MDHGYHYSKETGDKLLHCFYVDDCLVSVATEKEAVRFRITLKDQPLTRRGILSTVSSIYDTLGMLSPVTLTAKRILRDLCRRGMGWDDTVPE